MLRNVKSQLLSFFVTILICLCIPSLSANAKNRTYTGSGDDVITLAANDYNTVFKISGNAADKFFSVVSYGKKGEWQHLLVSTADPYEGIVYNEGKSAATLKITATGKWKITMMPLKSVRKIKKNQKISGKGDSVLFLANKKWHPTIAKIKGNSNKGYFGIVGYTRTGGYGDLLVNTTDVYSGTVRCEPDLCIYQIQASGKWTILFK